MGRVANTVKYKGSHQQSVIQRLTDKLKRGTIEIHTDHRQTGNEEQTTIKYQILSVVLFGRKYLLKICIMYTVN